MTITATGGLVEAFEVFAEGLGRYTIDVSVTTGAATAERLLVILVVDGNIHFDLVRTLVHGRYPALYGVLPRSVVVGVGYPADEGVASWAARRGYDFHDPWDMTDPLGASQRDMVAKIAVAEGRKDAREMRAGGFARFMAFLRDELLPLLAERYPVDVDGGARHTLIGHSSGGLFAVRAAFDPRSPFSRYVAVSPGGGGEGALEAG